MSIYLGSNQIDTINLISYQSFNTNIEDALINKTITSYSNSEISNIRNYAFAYCSSLTSINLPQATLIGYSTFAYCSTLISINLPQANSIGSYAFYYCSSLTSVSLPQATTIGSYAFAYCYSLASINLPQVISVGSNAFYSCRHLTSISLPQATTIGGSAFTNCSSLTSINLPQATTIGTCAFYNCSALTSIDLPKVTTIESYTFSGCSALTSIDLPKVTIIGSYAFRSCHNLLSLCLLGSSIPTLARINAFMTTPISDYTTSTSGVYGSIYVPASLYSSYIAASNWSTYSARIVGVGTMTINYYMDQYSEEYLYEPSMTWADWVNSKYNTVGFVAINSNHIGILDDETGLYHYLEDSSTGDEVLSNELVADYANTGSLYMGIYLSKSGFGVMDNSDSELPFVYEIDMTWAEWVDSFYNTVNFVVDPETSYVGIWDYNENVYIYLINLDDESIVISTRKIIDDLRNKSNWLFKINTSLS